MRVMVGGTVGVEEEVPPEEPPGEPEELELAPPEAGAEFEPPLIEPPTCCAEPLGVAQVPLVCTRLPFCIETQYGACVIWS